MDLINEDREVRNDLAALGAVALKDLAYVLNWPPGRRRMLLESWEGRPERAGLAQLIAMADTDNVIRLRLLRAIRDLGVS